MTGPTDPVYAAFRHKKLAVSFLFFPDDSSGGDVSDRNKSLKKVPQKFIAALHHVCLFPDR
jgi:hypothetical protein